MKLRNRRTGEIGKLSIGCSSLSKRNLYVITNKIYEYVTLASLFEEWEDYEEPKGIWYVGELGEPLFADHLCDYDTKHLKKIGNYFETKEEAEKVVEKLKAWKRLKDKGFKFECWYGGSKLMSFSIPQEIIDKPTAKDLDLLFGGEE